MGNTTNEIALRHSARQKNKRKRFAFLISVLFILVLVFTVILASMLTPLFNVRNVIVKGNVLVEAEDVINSLGTDENSKIFTIDKKLMKKRVESLPYVKSAKIQRRIWGSVIVEIEETEVGGYIMNGQNAVLFDDVGKIVNITGNALNGIPEILGCTLTPGSVGEKLSVDSDEKFDIILLYISEFNKAGIKDKMTKLDVSDVLNVTGIYENRYDIMFGDGNSLEDKIAIMVKAIGHNAENEMGTIDLRILGNAYLKPERTFVESAIGQTGEQTEAEQNEGEELAEGDEAAEGDGSEDNTEADAVSVGEEDSSEDGALPENQVSTEESGGENSEENTQDNSEESSGTQQ